MNGQAFAFREGDAEQLHLVLGRRDAGAVRFVEDAEAILGSYLEAARTGLRNGLPAQVADDLAQVERQAAALREGIGRLPSDVSAMVNLHLASEDARQRIVRDVRALEAALDDLSAALAVLRGSPAGDGAGRLNLLRQLLFALAEAYRNRLNIRPRFGPEDLFPRAVQTLLILAARQAEAFAVVRDGLRPELLRHLLAPLEEKEELAKATPARAPNPFLPASAQDQGPMLLGGD